MFKTPTLLLLLLQIHCAFSANVLFFLHGTNQFDRHVFEFLAQQIALRHHNVITVKPILIPEEPRLVKPRLHLVKEKIVKNLLPQELYGPIERVGSSVPWERNYQLDAYNHPYWAGYNASCYKLINSNLMDTLKKEQIEVALVYSGNPCQLAMVHALSIPFIYYDLDGLTDETIIASGMPWNLKTLSSRSVPETKFSELSTGLALIYETVCQLGLPVVGGALCERVRLLEDPITRIFREDYEIKKRFKPFPHVNW
uniref:Lysosomal acid lipase/cholesteryl ester hydrolase n=2 Tax=Bursaphelenchus xylophilus TaxID=6326 RepID=A0A1I7RVV2_BURXY